MFNNLEIQRLKTVGRVCISRPVRVKCDQISYDRLTRQWKGKTINRAGMQEKTIECPFGAPGTVLEIEGHKVRITSIITRKTDKHTIWEAAAELLGAR